MRTSFTKLLFPIITTAALCIPTKTAKDELPIFNQTEIVNNPTHKILSQNSISPKDLNGLVLETDTNFAGGITHHFSSESVQKLKNRICKPEILLKYQAPIENLPNVYLEPFGYFFANRPNGNKKRPHMGLDIFVSPLSRKPKTPIAVKAPVNGVIISSKKAREEDNVISNCVVLLGQDGRRYAFDHLARPNDYSDSIPLPKVGTIMEAGDSIGYVGSTGETTMWHLHLTVMTDEEQETQNKSKYWKTLAEQSGYTALRGQVNPLDRKKAGPIADCLSEYKGGKINLKGDFKLE